jgi:hypothetical protein
MTTIIAGIELAIGFAIVGFFLWVLIGSILLAKGLGE